MLGVIAIVAVATKYIRLPYTVARVVAVAKAVASSVLCRLSDRV
jgi:hypothetical protein